MCVFGPTNVTSVCVCVFQCQRLDGDRCSDTQTKLHSQREKWKTRATTLSERMSCSSPRLPVFILSPHSLSFTVPFSSALCLPATSASLTWALIWKSLTSHSPKLGGSFQRCICSKPLTFSSNAHAGWIKDEFFIKTTTKSHRGGSYSSANPWIQ